MKIKEITGNPYIFILNVQIYSLKFMVKKMKTQQDPIKIQQDNTKKYKIIKNLENIIVKLIKFMQIYLDFIIKKVKKLNN